MNVYLPLYYTHVTCVILSGSFFLLRGVWMLRQSPALAHPVVRIAPHLIDTLLLASAIGLSLTLRQYPVAHDWVTVKVMALVVYIGFGMVALRRGRTKAVRVTAFVMAILTFVFIISVAVNHHPAGIFWRLFS